MSKNDAKLASILLKKETIQAKTTHFEESFEVKNPALVSGFRGMFGDAKLSIKEEGRLHEILNQHAMSETAPEYEIEGHYIELKKITSEIKAISNQSILLHGERIKKAQDILRNYKDGAFTDWLMSTYGNRQTPYSMLQYYEFYHSLPVSERSIIENMPKKAVYTLASREGSLDLKLDIIKNYNGEKQNEVISIIQEAFPSDEDDKRVRTSSEPIFIQIDRLISKLEARKKRVISEYEKERIADFIKRLAEL